jgi:Ca2+/Na+ antiporter
MKLNHAQKRAASFAAAVLVVMFGSMLFEPAHQAVTSTLAAAGLLGLPAVFVFLVAFASGTSSDERAQHREGNHA